VQHYRCRHHHPNNHIGNSHAASFVSDTDRRRRHRPCNTTKQQYSEDEAVRGRVVADDSDETDEDGQVDDSVLADSLTGKVEMSCI
tara:strand:- start:365 stop:622 length:258 start_codon:yes stop_codon:yes gene_type:complete